MSWFDSIKQLLGRRQAPTATETRIAPPPQAEIPTAPLPAVPGVATDTDAPESTPETQEAASQGAPGGRERRERERVSPPRGTRVLIVDDSPTIVALLRRMLVQNNYDVGEAGDAESALAKVPEFEPDLIFLDIVLPGMNGFEALRRLRRNPDTRHIPVIMISGNELATEQFYAQRIGADDFMKKPFSRSEVFLRIEKLLGPDRMPHRAIVAPSSATES
ncbi:MAG: response regulator [Lysobacteraceae bacterium]